MKLLRRVTNDLFVAAAYIEAYVAGKWVANLFLRKYDSYKSTHTDPFSSQRDSVWDKVNHDHTPTS